MGDLRLLRILFGGPFIPADEQRILCTVRSIVGHHKEPEQWFTTALSRRSPAAAYDRAVRRLSCLDKRTIVSEHAADAMHEASNPLETLVNLHYLIRHTRHDPEQVLAYLEQAETQTLRLMEIKTSILRAHLEAMNETKEESGKFVM